MLNAETERIEKFFYEMQAFYSSLSRVLGELEVGYHYYGDSEERGVDEFVDKLLAKNRSILDRLYKIKEAVEAKEVVEAKITTKLYNKIRKFYSPLSEVLGELTEGYNYGLGGLDKEEELDKSAGQLLKKYGSFIQEFDRIKQVLDKYSEEVTISDLKDDKSTASELKDNKPIESELKPGKWFLIDRNVIDENRDKIRSECYEFGDKIGKAYCKRFENSNKIADENPDQYPRVMEVYIFEGIGKHITVPEAQHMCEKVGKGMCDEVICNFELQMRICKGESAEDLFQKPDKLPYKRMIKLRNGGTGFFGGCTTNGICNKSPGHLQKFVSHNHDYNDCVPYAFRPVLS